MNAPPLTSLSSSELAGLVREVDPAALLVPPRILRRVSGYNLLDVLPADGESRNGNTLTAGLLPVLVGSEGTLAAISSAELKISPLPREKGLGLVFFASVADAMQATVALLDLQPAAIEHIDRPLLDQTKGQLHFQAARDLMELDAKPCEAILIVEFYDDVAERLSMLQSRELGDVGLALRAARAVLRSRLDVGLDDLAART